MSFTRLVFYHSLFGGWAAFVGWFLAELILARRYSAISDWPLLFISALVGAFISAGLSQVPGLLHFNWAAQLKRLGLGFAGGFVGGFLGALLGNLIFGILP